MKDTALERAAPHAPERSRERAFWLGCGIIAVGVVLHLPTLAEAHRMNNQLHGMGMEGSMLLGMALIGIGVVSAVWGALPKRVPAWMQSSPHILPRRMKHP